MSLAGGIFLLPVFPAAAAGSGEDGIPGVLQYALKYSEEKKTGQGTPGKQEKAQPGKPAGRILPSGSAGSADARKLRRQLALREQELGQLRSELKRLRAGPVDGQSTEERAALQSLQQEKTQCLTGRDSLEKEVVALKQSLSAERQGGQLQSAGQAQLRTRAEQAEKEKAAVQTTLVQMEKQLSDERTRRTGTEAELEKQKAQTVKVAESVNTLTASLAEVRGTLATMPVVTPKELEVAGARQVYATGVMMGRDVLALQDTRTLLGLKTDARLLLAGMRDAVGHQVLLNSEVLQQTLTETEQATQKARKTVAAARKKAGEVWLAGFKKDRRVRQDSSGFWYRMDYPGDGKLIRGEDTEVEVSVTEKLTDGTVVEDMDAGGRTLSLALSDFPPLFRSALLLMKNHGTMTVVAPSSLAYGDAGYPPKVPPGAMMVYTLRVESVTPVPDIVLPEGRGRDAPDDRKKKP